MSRLICLCLGLLLSATGGGLAYDLRVDPDAVWRNEIRVALGNEPMRALKASADGEITSGDPRLPREYGSAMTWYRVALFEGYAQSPVIASGWSYDERLPEPLHWTWIADTGDLITRVGRGVFRLSFADSRINWFRDLDCRLMSWPDGETKAPMTCDDGSQRMMQIPGDGIVRVDGVKYARVFHSEVTVLPREETLEEIMARQDLATTAAVPGLVAGTEPEPVQAEAQPEPEPTPANVPIPRPRPTNPF